MSSELDDQVRNFKAHVEKRLLAASPMERMEPLADLLNAVADLATLLKTIRRDTLAELVNEYGLEAVAKALDASEDRVINVLGAPTKTTL